MSGYGIDRNKRLVELTGARSFCLQIDDTMYSLIEILEKKTLKINLPSNFFYYLEPWYIMTAKIKIR